MRIGIDLGGTKIEGVVLDDAGNELLRKRVDTRQSEGYQAILHRTAQLASYLEAEIGRKCSIGIGTPGAISGPTRKAGMALATMISVGVLGETSS